MRQERERRERREEREEREGSVLACRLFFGAWNKKKKKILRAQSKFRLVHNNMADCSSSSNDIQDDDTLLISDGKKQEGVAMVTHSPNPRPTLFPEEEEERL